MAGPPHTARTPLLLVGGFAAFLAVLAALLLAPFGRRDVTEFAPSPPASAPPGDHLIIDTITVDAQDPVSWRHVSFARGGILPPGDTAGWDLAFRRFTVIPSGAVANVGPVEFDSLAEAPPRGYVATDIERDTVNTAIARWYRYSFVTHLLHPGEQVYVLRTASGRFAKIQFLGYYCPGAVAGCVTMRYAYQPDGSRTLR